MEQHGGVPPGARGVPLTSENSEVELFFYSVKKQFSAAAVRMRRWTR